MAENKATRHALVLGATGLVGGHCLRLVLDSGIYSQVTALTRRKIPLAHSRLVQVQTDFSDLELLLQDVHVDDVFCCLGTTIKKAGDEAAFRLVDLELPLKIAALAKENGASHYLVVTAMGADRRSMFFYNRVKGELEKALSQLVYPFLTILRPSLLTGEREEVRPLEMAGGQLLAWVSPFMKGPFLQLKPVSAEKVARAMVDQAKLVAEGHRSTGVLIVDSAQMQAQSESLM